jgi:hypothetical protein
MSSLKMHNLHYSIYTCLFTFTVEVPDNGIEVEAFQNAAELGIHRTVHAGEAGPAEMVRRVSGSSLMFSCMIIYYFSLTT